MNNMRLTEEAELSNLEFFREYGDGNCSCHISPPCGSCTHPGNPVNQAEDENCWEPDLPDAIASMKAADLTTTGHEVHYRACISCGKDFKFTDSWCCPACVKQDDERKRRYSHENKLFRANGVFK
jgi:hypothetical protein